MHLPMNAPGFWLPFFLHSVAAPGLPMVLAGHNQYIAWSLTISYVDTEDLFELLLDQSETKYLYDGQWRELTIEHEEIIVKGWPRRSFPLTLRSSHHGPIISDAAERFVAARHRNRPLALSSLASRARCPLVPAEVYAARTWTQLFEIVANRGCSGLVATWGDVAGNVGSFLLGGVPKRRDKVGPFAVHDGTRATGDWENLLPAEAVAHLMNPPIGFVSASNSFISPDPGGERYGRAFSSNDRQRRVQACLLAATTPRLEGLQPATSAAATAPETHPTAAAAAAPGHQSTREPDAANTDSLEVDTTRKLHDLQSAAPATTTAAAAAAASASAACSTGAWLASFARVWLPAVVRRQWLAGERCGAAGLGSGRVLLVFSKRRPMGRWRL
eukprot:GHVT01075100.1.p1 GENE.GHVT01075100.1~~GHVT01075100.1.p1  ORF type:complete len:387 (+),score=78.49 GHVT01075100.1:577-1737(+)